MAPQTAFHLRPAVEDDVPLVLAFIHELADYENLLHEVCADEASIRETLFGPEPSAAALVAECEGRGAGFALYHGMYSTFLARPGIYLEDLYVRPEFRGRGIGRALLTRLARIAVDTGQCRLDWSCLDWNGPSLAFYRGLGARQLDEWVRLRLDGDELESLARKAIH